MDGRKNVLTTGMLQFKEISKFQEVMSCLNDTNRLC